MADSVKWAVPGLFHADAQKVSEEIHGIGEEVTPEEVLNYAEEHPSSELYRCFTWDDTEAARRYRLDQAATIIRSIVIVTTKPDIPMVREFELTSHKSTYAPTRTFLVKKDEYQALLQRAMNELKAFRQKYKTIKELQSIFNMIDEL